MTAMPIAASIISTKQLGYSELPVVAPQGIGQQITREATHFNVQIASELYWRGSQNEYSLKSDYGPLRLPFPAVWMEWRLPPQVMIRGKLRDFDPIRVGRLLTETPEPGGYLIESVSVFMGNQPGEVASLSPVILRFSVDEDGRLLPDGRGVRCVYNEDAFDRARADWHHEADMGHLHVACLALNLINCKNVTTEVAGKVQARRSGAQKRRREPQITYRTIRLPGAPCGGEATGENEGTMPLHRVRGHFKTFTEEAPLLGKHTGTYWWGWQVRGKKANGEVISDYELRDAS